MLFCFVIGELQEMYEIERIVSWIKDLDVQKVALQFPDDLLKDAPDVALRIECASNNIDIHILGILHMAGT